MGDASMDLLVDVLRALRRHHSADEIRAALGEAERHEREPKPKRGRRVFDPHAAARRAAELVPIDEVTRRRAQG